MNNPFIAIVKESGLPTYKVFDSRLKGIVSNTTWFNLINSQDIPNKMQWATVERVADALGYEIVFQQKNGEQSE